MFSIVYDVLLQAFLSINDILIWIVLGGGAAIIFGLLSARFLENLVFWHNLPKWVKKIVPVIGAGLIGILAQSLIAVDIGQYIPEWVAAMIIAAVNLYYNQKEYGLIKDTSYAEGARIEAANLKLPT